MTTKTPESRNFRSTLTLEIPSNLENVTLIIMLTRRYKRLLNSAFSMLNCP